MSVQTEMAVRDVVVVGGGMAGLTAACYLAKAGLSVTVLEKATELGGRATTQNYDGYLLNRGAHALYSGGATTEVLKDLGVSFTARIPKGVFALRQNELYPAPANTFGLFRTRLLSLADKVALARLFTGLPRIKAEELKHVSVKEWIDRSVSRPNVHKFLTAFAQPLVYSSNLELVSAQIFVEKTQRSLKHPIFYIEGGWQTFVDGLAQQAAQAGVEIITSAFVESLEYRNGEVYGVRLRDGRVIEGRAVVVATTPKAAAKLVDRPELQAAVDKLTPGYLACLDVALKRLPTDRYPVVQDLDQPRFLTTQSLFLKIAPEDGAVVSLFKQLDPLAPSDPHQDEQDLETMLDVVQPGWRKEVVKRVYLPHIEAVGMLPTARGGGYDERPDYQVKGVSNLYLAGDWVGPEGFLTDASFASARQVARLVLKELVGAGKVARV